MPRGGKGQKVQTAHGQQYGQAQKQEEAQRIISLPQMEQPSVPRQRPGQMPFNRASDRPNETVTTQIDSAGMASVANPQRRFDAMRALVALEPLASVPGASPHLRNTVRRLKSFVGDVNDFASMNPVSEQM